MTHSNSIHQRVSAHGGGIGVENQDRLNSAYLQMSQQELLDGVFRAISHLNDTESIQGLAKVGSYLTQGWGNDADCEREELEAQKVSAHE
ncbi:MAG: hypothetical protein GKR95_20040 [Gammaproteobacteria bacterium]|nr:hypothetical protein [Gammaproteobacteria bacterium]